MLENESSEFHLILTRDMYTDIKIIGKDAVQEVHLAIIYARAPGFFNWIVNNENEGAVYLRNFSSESILNYLSLVYGNHPLVTDKKVKKVIKFLSKVTGEKPDTFHSENLMVNDMAKIYNQKEFSDFQIKCSDKETIYLHKVILCKNPFFKEKFLDLKLKELKVNFDSNSAHIIFNYMYSSNIELNELNLPQTLSLLLVSNLFTLTTLETLCSIKVCRYLTVNNRAIAKQWCSNNNLQYLKKAIVTTSLKGQKRESGLRFFVKDEAKKIEDVKGAGGLKKKDSESESDKTSEEKKGESDRTSEEKKGESDRTSEEKKG